MAVINTSSEIGMFVTQATNVTGSLWLTLLGFMFFVVALGVAFRIPSELIGLILLPFIFVGILITTNFLGALAVVILILALFFARQISF